MDNNEFVLQIKELNFGYKKDKLIYNNFSLNLKKSEVKSIVGASGSGKSTLFELITKSLKPLKGHIISSKIASIYQDPYSSFHPTYSILDQINDVVPNINKEELNSLLEELSLDYDLILNKPHKLSGGQLQRCSILRALLMKPELLLVDEATSALDNIIALDVMKLVLKFLPNYGILLITHDMHLASWCSDEIIKLDIYE
ncbi:ATP-binding cassette domain-containing protein [Arcobacter sp. F2176]|uniref:ATP-binding cassette domain-containing protein n=1 Tax=unclassified Arcobacter TaxID=2593671 RepID=UPI00100AA159|nr:ATP-binding cassette domain-containing protein [Arcobacter sp. F2176]RXJ81757.1 peptide ABC transporter ATP-binding protein [Arcobacter sp. F2176]